MSHILKKLEELDKKLLTTHLSQRDVEYLIAKYIYITPAISMINNYIRENNIHINMEIVIAFIYYSECQRHSKISRSHGTCSSYYDFESDYIKPKYLDKYIHMFSCISGDYLCRIGLQNFY